jgi:hypothetical protein
MSILIFLVIGIAIAAGTYFFLIKKKSTAPTYTPTAPGWQNDGGNVSVNADGSFHFGEPHYISRANGPLQPGQTITCRFRITGNGEFVASDPAEGPPCHVSLFFERAGDDRGDVVQYQFYRWFSHARAELTGAAEYTVSSELVQDQWGPVGGDGASNDPNLAAAGFADAMANAAVVGFTFGGQYFAGHGISVKPGTGAASFTLLDFSIG